MLLLYQGQMNWLGDEGRGVKVKVKVTTTSNIIAASGGIHINAWASRSKYHLYYYDKAVHKILSYLKS